MTITTETVTDNAPTIVLVQRDPDGPVTYVAIDLATERAIDILRRALIHLVATAQQVQTVPVSAVVVPSANGTKPNEVKTRKKPGPKKGTKPPRKAQSLDDIDDDNDDDFDNDIDDGLYPPKRRVELTDW